VKISASRWTFIRGEAALSAVAVAFGSTRGGLALPTHQLSELGLGPPVALTQNTDVRADDCGLGLRDLAGSWTAPGHNSRQLRTTIRQD
jgi:hypothetical protein